VLRLNCSTPWLPNPLYRQGYLPLHDLLSKICDKTKKSALVPCGGRLGQLAPVAGPAGWETDR